MNRNYAIWYFWKEYSKTNPRNEKSLNLDQDLRRNHQMNKREISKKLKSRKIKIEIEIDSNYDSKMKSKAIRRMSGWNTIPNPRLLSNWSNYLPDSRFFIKILKPQSLMFKRRFLPRLSTKSHSQALRGCGNESRSYWFTIGSKRFKGFVSK